LLGFLFADYALCARAHIFALRCCAHSHHSLSRTARTHKSARRILPQRIAYLFHLFLSCGDHSCSVVWAVGTAQYLSLQTASDGTRTHLGRAAFGVVRSLPSVCRIFSFHSCIGIAQIMSAFYQDFFLPRPLHSTQSFVICMHTHLLRARQSISRLRAHTAHFLRSAASLYLVSQRLSWRCVSPLLQHSFHISTAAPPRVQVPPYRIFCVRGAHRTFSRGRDRGRMVDGGTTSTNRRRCAVASWIFLLFLATLRLPYAYLVAHLANVVMTSPSCSLPAAATALWFLPLARILHNAFRRYKPQKNIRQRLSFISLFSWLHLPLRRWQPWAVLCLYLNGLSCLSLLALHIFSLPT